MQVNTGLILGVAIGIHVSSLASLPCWRQHFVAKSLKLLVLSEALNVPAFVTMAIKSTRSAQTSVHQDWP